MRHGSQEKALFFLAFTSDGSRSLTGAMRVASSNQIRLSDPPRYPGEADVDRGTWQNVFALSAMRQKCS